MPPIPERAIDVDAVRRLRELRTFNGNDGAFWMAFAEQAARLLRAEFAVVYRKQNEQWQPYCFWPVGQGKAAPRLSADQVDLLAGKALNGVPVYAAFDAEGSSSSLVGMGLDRQGDMLAVFGRSAALKPEEYALDQVKRELLVEILEGFRMHRAMHEVRREAAKAYEPLDLMLCLNEHTRFQSLVMALCNELAARFSCSRVSLGWVSDNYIRMQAVSHMERFERKMEVVQALEAVMEECLDQDEEVLVPAEESSSVLTAEHERFRERHGEHAMLSLPLRLEQKVVAVVSLERETIFTEDDLHALRTIADQVTRRLGDLWEYDRWFGARMRDALHAKLEQFVGPEHTWMKVAAAVAVLVIGVLLFGRIEYKVDAPFILRTEDLAFLSVPFDGYIDEAYHKPGDLVMKGQHLLELDTREFRLEEAQALADYQRYLREQEKSMSQNRLADMRVAEALKKQARSRLELIRYKLEQAELKAPFNGIVVEGDLERLLGAPVRKGDILLKVARLEDLYVEMNVSERDIHEFSELQEGNIAFLGRPGEKIRMVVERIEPMAVVEKDGNIFHVIGRIAGAPEPWLRPGMSGLAKVDVGKRQIAWILLHRTIDFFRMNLWW
ncbi:efflux transporter, RND family, MFP subunit [Prosthecochloris sp. CIB 2401]|nr:efflux transporter, RND family, MFP subunit [Prosthecochloris sp. CIB 2401]